MSIVSPSILSADFLNLEKEIKSFEDCEDLWFHLDVMDGHYVPNLTFGKTVLKNVHKITKHPLDAHLMVSNPEDFLNDFADLGLHNLTFHWEACVHHDSMVSEIKNLYPSCGISLNPGTPLSVVPDYILQKIDLLLIMSVNPGFGGQSFIPSSFDKVKEAARKREELGAKFLIQVDGGVSDKNAKKLRDAGADILVAGSFIFTGASKDYKSKIKELR